VAADDLLTAFIVMLYRKGVIDAADMTALADEFGVKGDDEKAHLVNCLIVEAEAPAQADWQAEQARKRLRIVQPDGGKRAD
jgi:hypothetical protein